MLPLIEKINENREAFGNKVESIAAALNFPAPWLMFVMWFESKLNSKAVNSATGAAGLIQFMPTTAKGLGTSTQQLLQMSNVNQLNFVYKYLQPFKGKIKTFEDLYLSIFFPLAVGKPESYVLETKNLSADTIAKANKIFDLDNNNQITVAEIKGKLFSVIPEAFRKVIEAIKKNPAKATVAALSFAVLLYLYFKK